MYKAGSPGSGAKGRGQERQNGSGWDLTAGFSLLLPAASLLESQVGGGAIGHVVVSQRGGILDEDALIVQLLFPCRKIFPCPWLHDLHLDSRDLACE